VRYLFWISWGISAIVTGVFVYFFFAGLEDGTVSSYNAALWAVILLGVAGVTGGSLWLKRAGHPIAAVVVASLLGVPGLLAALLLIVLLVAQPRWN
jgi:hypothetical protein